MSENSLETENPFNSDRCQGKQCSLWPGAAGGGVRMQDAALKDKDAALKDDANRTPMLKMDPSEIF